MGCNQCGLPNEIAMQQAWRFRLWGTGKLLTSQGKTVEIVEAGKWNTGAGPDFTDAKIKVDDKVWVGCIEIHRRASDWHRHGHDTDRTYDNVVLHVVGDDDFRVKREDGTEILHTVMRIGDGFASLFNGLLNGGRLVLPMCGDALGEVVDIFRTDWLTALAFERLNRKSDDIAKHLLTTSGNWFQAVFITLARGLGFGSNADNMERMARSIPFKILLRHSDNVETVEALLFGQANLLNNDAPADDYEESLIREYRFYAHKYGLQPIDKPLWRMSVRSLANTPYRRIALLAKLVCVHGTELGRRLCERRDVDAIRKFLCVDLSEYWTYHSTFGRQGSARMVSLGSQSQDLLIINVLAPLIYCHGLEHNRSDQLDSAITLWENIPAEKNGITRGFEAFGIKAGNAFMSQALIQLHREYCERRRCVECRLGHRLLSSFITFNK